MMGKLKKRMRENVTFELEESRRNFEQLFSTRKQAHAVLFEEVNEAEDEMGKVIDLGIRLNQVLRAERSAPAGREGTILRDMEECAVCAACEAVQVAAMCRKWRESLGTMDAVADGDSKSANLSVKKVADNGR